MTSNRRIQVGSILTAFVLAVAVPTMVAGQPAKVIDTFTATTIGMNPGAGETLRIDLLRWSTQAEIDKLIAGFPAKGEMAWTGDSPLGYVWAGSQALGYTVRYAHHLTTADGERIIIGIDRPLGSWGLKEWKAIGPSATTYPFSIIELRLRRTGPGEGKASLAAKVVVEPEIHAIALENYAAAPQLLKDVKRVGGNAAVPSSASSK